MAHAHAGVGLRIAQVGGALMLLGGLVDVAIPQLLPNHRAFLGYADGAVPASTAALVLIMLHALGAALAAAGLAVLALLREARASNRTAPAIVAAIVTVMAEGMTALGMWQTGSPLTAGPLVIVVMVVVGVATFVSARRA